MYWRSPESSILNEPAHKIIFGGPVQTKLCCQMLTESPTFVPGMICTWYVNCSSFNGDRRDFSNLQAGSSSWLAERIVIQSSLVQTSAAWNLITSSAQPQNGEVPINAGSTYITSTHQKLEPDTGGIFCVEIFYLGFGDQRTVHREMTVYVTKIWWGSFKHDLEIIIWDMWALCEYSS